jgi:hypothetical protein
MRSANLEDLPRRQGTRRDGRDHDHRHGADVAHRAWLRMVRFLRTRVGRHWTEALAELDQAARDWRFDPQVLREQRESLRGRLFGRRWGGVRARDGDLRVDPRSGRLLFEQDSRKRGRRAPECFDVHELRREPELIRRARTDYRDG